MYSDGINAPNLGEAVGELRGAENVAYLLQQVTELSCLCSWHVPSCTRSPNFKQFRFTPDIVKHDVKAEGGGGGKGAGQSSETK